jgi:hypothetical protein
VNLYVLRNGTAWRFAAWIDGKLDRLGDLGIAGDANEAEAMETARQMYAPYAGHVTVTRVSDLVGRNSKAPRSRFERSAPCDTALTKARADFH